MPKIRTLKSKPPPAGFEDIEAELEELNRKMREAELEPHDGKRKNESLWPVIRVNHQRSRFVFNLYFREKKISKELFDYLLKEQWADAALIAKWKKPGFDNLCCLQCVMGSAHNHGGACICRVPRRDLDKGKLVECQACGCRGCASGD